RGRRRRADGGGVCNLRADRRPQAGGPPQRGDRHHPRLAWLRCRDHARQPGDGSRLMSSEEAETKQQATKLEEQTRATAEAAKAAGGKLASLGGEGGSELLRALAAALREPGVRAEVSAANAKDLERAKAENVATPLV